MEKKVNVVVGLSVNAEMMALYDGQGEKVPGTELHMDLGGSSANVTAAFNNFGINGILLGLVGHKKGTYQDDMLNLVLNNVSITFKRIPALTDTNFALISKNIGAEKGSLIGYRGTILSDRISFAKTEILKSDGDWRVATGVTEDQFELAIALLGKEKIGQRSLGPHRSWCLNGDKQKLIELMHYTDLFILNKEEFTSLNISMSEIHTAGPRLIVVTDGENGGEYSLDNTSQKFDAIQAENIVSFVGAGDWFHAGLLIGLIDQSVNIATASSEHLLSAIKFAAHVAAKKIAVNGGSQGPTRGDIN